MKDIKDNLPTLPKAWAWTKIEDICFYPQYGWTTSATKNGTVHLLRTTDITSGWIDWSKVPYCSDVPENPEKYFLEDGDIVISRAGSVGYSYLLKSPPKAIFASYLIRFRTLISKKYFSYFLKCPMYWNSITEEKIGIAVPNVNASKIKNIYLPLPPLNEQSRIASKIEELFTRLDAGVEELKAAKEKIKRYRQAVLKAAVEGKLTEKWREAHKHELEPASKLLERIQKERKAKLGKKYKEPEPVDISALPELPEGWEWTTVETLAHVGTGATPLKSKTEYYKNGNIPWVTSSAVNNEFIRDPNDWVTSKALNETNLTIYPANTLLVAMYGEGKTRGKCSELLIEATTNQALAALVLGGIAFESRQYIKLFFLHNYNEIRKLSSGGVQPNLNLEIIKKTLIPLPPSLEQKIIFDEVERKLSIGDEADRLIDRSLRESERLRQSILKKAFEGKLVPQDPKDEPAEKLLERILAAKKESGGRKKFQVRNPVKRK